MIDVAHRLKQVEEYYFSKKLRDVALLKLQGKPIINLGIGSPDLAPSPQVITALTESLHNANAHSYQSYQGLPELKKGISNFYKTHFKVTLNPQTEVLPLMGSKEGIMHISMAFLNKGDHVLVPNPGYPTYSSVTKLLEAKPIYYNLKATHNWLPDFKALEQLDLSNVKLMWLNYPHMPTGTNATAQFYKDVIAFGKRHHILIINDNPYSFIRNKKPLSLLHFDTAKTTCLELNSLSKTFNMAGWRVGMLLGNADCINAVLKVKSNMDSGMFYGIQKGAIAALKSSEDWFLNLNNTYNKRHRLIGQLAEKLNCTYTKNTTGLFVWAKIPKGKTSEEFTDALLYNTSIFITPGTVFGSNGEGYVRFSLCATEAHIKEAIARV